MNYYNKFYYRRKSLVCLIMVSLFANLRAQGPDFFVQIEDPVLEKSIRLKVGNLTDPLTKTELSQVEDLVIIQKNTRASTSEVIQSLNGIEFLKNLIELKLQGISTRVDGRSPVIRVEDYTILRTLEHLQILDLSFNNLKSIILPHGMKNLEKLNFHRNDLTIFELPAGMESLRVLDLSHQTGRAIDGGPYGGLEEIRFPGDSNQLEAIDLSENYLKKLILPDGLIHLKHLWLQKQCTDIEFYPKKNPYQFTQLYLPNDLVALETLYLGRTGLKQIKLATGFVDLQTNNVHIPQGTQPPSFFVKVLKSFRITYYFPLQIIRQNNDLVLKWEGGALHSSYQLHGPWTPVSNATSPYLAKNSKTKVFLFD